MPVDATFSGRSMVEMLGVLAIIGVLSVGAIAGYSKAMMKYKLNKFSEQLNTLVSACIRYSQSFMNLTTSQYVTEYFIKLGEIPEDMIKNDSYFVYDIYGRAHYMYQFQTQFLVLYSYGSGIVTDSTENFEICQTYINIAKANSANILRVELISGVNDEDEQSSRGVMYGDTTCSSNVKCLKDLQLNDIYEQCRFLLQGKGWQFSIRFI